MAESEEPAVQMTSPPSKDHAVDPAEIMQTYMSPAFQEIEPVPDVKPYLEAKDRHSIAAIEANSKEVFERARQHGSSLDSQDPKMMVSPSVHDLHPTEPADHNTPKFTIDLQTVQTNKNAHPDSPASATEIAEVVKVTVVQTEQIKFGNNHNDDWGQSPIQEFRHSIGTMATV